MGKKKGKKKKGKKGKKKASGDDEVYELPFELESVNKYVTLHPVMYGWKHARALWPREGIELKPI